MQYCCLQHRTLLPSPVTSTTGCCFCFGSIPSFFLELFLHWSPVAYWAPTNLGSSSFSILSFCLFMLFVGFSRQEYWSDLPFPSPVDHIVSDLSTMTHLSWVAPHGMALHGTALHSTARLRQEMARLNVDILGISELKWTGMGEFTSDDHYIYYCRHESRRRNGVARVWNEVLGCNLRMILVFSPRQTIPHHSN